MFSAKTKGFTCGIIAAVTYGMNPLFTLPLYEEGLNADSVLFYRYGLAIVLLALLMKWKGESFRLQKKEIIPLVLAGLIFSSSSLLLFLSYNYMDAGIASTILFVYPVLVALIMMICFHERISPIVWGGILLALCGISFLSKGTDGAPLSLVGLAFVLLSSLSYAVYIVGVNQSILKNISIMRLTFYALVFGVLIYVVRLDFCMNLVPVRSVGGWCNVLALASLPTVVSLMCTTTAIHHIGSTPTAILGALEPVTALFFGVTLFHEQLTPKIMLGILMVLTAVTLIVVEKPVRERLRQRLRHLR
ncbi:DMT family transporter [Bacteroides sp. Marseille-P3684]|uniref:DMT family transporter n=1 Tax=Bacteroides sp. Marseille-P3684 TaxID=2086579 RepID=UPI000D105388|nr:DMT family transporter [Bacteroides sp. Marseille-P3684]